MAAEQRFAKPSQIIHTVYGKTNNDEVLPPVTTAMRTARRMRRKHKFVESNNINEVNIKDIKTYSNEDFCLADLKEKDDRLILLGTEKDVDRMMGCSEWTIDATYEIVPYFFYQMVTVMGKRYGKWFALLYVLMTGKTEDLYKKMWELILSIAKL